MKTMDEIRRVREGAEAELLRRPGVTGVDIGHKIVGGQKTDLLAIRVYVKEKRDVSEMESIPVEIEGVPTDVIEREFKLRRSNKDANF